MDFPMTPVPIQPILVIPGAIDMLSDNRGERGEKERNEVKMKETSTLKRGKDLLLILFLFFFVELKGESELRKCNCISKREERIGSF